MSRILIANAIARKGTALQPVIAKGELIFLPSEALS